MSDHAKPALTPRQARLAERVDAVRRAFALEMAAPVDGPATLEALWRPGEHLGWVLTLAGADDACGWLNAPSRSWESLAVATDSAWWMTPRAAGRHCALIAFDTSGAEIAR